MDRAEPRWRARAGGRGARRWPKPIAEPRRPRRARRLAYDEMFANQLALLLLRQASRRQRGVPLAGDGRLTDKLRLPYTLTGAQRRVIEEIRGDMAQAVPMLRLLQGDVGSGKTLVALMAMLAAVEAGAQAALLAPTEILARQHHATLLGAARRGRRARRDPHRPREGQGARSRADGPRRRLDRHPRRHPRDLPGEGRLQEPRAGRDRRAAPLRRVAAAAAVRQGGAAAASAGDDRDADPAHADADPIWRDGRQPDRRDAAGPHAGRNAGDQRRAAARGRSTGSAAISRAAARPIGCARWSRRARRATPPPPRSARAVLRLRFGDDGSAWSTGG